MRFGIGLSIYFLFSFLALNAQQTSLEEADSLYALGNYTRAINAYSRAGTLEAALQIARAYNAIGNYDKAVVQYRNVVIKDSSLHIARFELGTLYLKIGEPKNAAALFFDLITEDSDNPEYFYYMGNALGELQSKENIQYYKSAVTLDSTHLRSLFQLGKHNVAKGERDLALKYTDMGLQFYQNDVALINLKALAYFNNDEYEKAKPLFERLLELGEYKEHIYNKLAYCYYKNWELEKANETYKALLEFDNARSEAFFGLGNTSWRAKELDSAALYFRKAIDEKRPYLGNEYNALARLARVQDDLKTALEYYRKAYQEDIENPSNYYQLCALADQYYKDPNVKLRYYETFIEKFGKNKTYMSVIAQKRIQALKEEIHFAHD